MYVETPSLTSWRVQQNYNCMYIALHLLMMTHSNINCSIRIGSWPEILTDIWIVWLILGKTHSVRTQTNATISTHAASTFIFFILEIAMRCTDVPQGMHGFSIGLVLWETKVTSVMDQWERFNEFDIQSDPWKQLFLQENKFSPQNWSASKSSPTFATSWTCQLER